MDPEKVLVTAKTSLYNLTVLNFIFLALSYPVTSWWGSLHTSGQLPTFGELVLQFTGCKIVKELGFYYGHRLVRYLTS